jgi:hypothetical protein
LDIRQRALAGVREALGQYRAAAARVAKTKEFVSVPITILGLETSMMMPADLVPESGRIDVVWPAPGQMSEFRLSQVPAVNGNGHR